MTSVDIDTTDNSQEMFEKHEFFPDATFKSLHVHIYKEHLINNHKLKTSRNLICWM